MQLAWLRIWLRAYREPATMSAKQKQPLPKHSKQQIPLDKNQTGRRGIEPEEMHRQGGNRISDQGNRKGKGDKN